jgi:hypothetical protein
VQRLPHRGRGDLPRRVALLGTDAHRGSSAGRATEGQFGNARKRRTTVKQGEPMIRKWMLYPVDGPFTLPAEAKVIHVGEQKGLPVVWTKDIVPLLHTDYNIQIFGTGETPPEDSEHVGSVQMTDGLVWHVFKLDTYVRG